jgi:hypothetical protein
MEAADRDAVLEATLAQHPGAFIGAIGVNGLFVELPAALRDRGLRPIEGPASALGLACPADHTLLVETWHRLLAEGVANCRFRPLAPPDRPARMPRTARLHLVDARHNLGVVVMMITGLEDSPATSTGCRNRAATPARASTVK